MDVSRGRPRLTQSKSDSTAFPNGSDTVHAPGRCSGTNVNLATAGVDYHVPFGGPKKSSYGSREQGFAAVEFYTQIKTSYSAG